MYTTITLPTVVSQFARLKASVYKESIKVYDETEVIHYTRHVYKMSGKDMLHYITGYGIEFCPISSQERDTASIKADDKHWMRSSHVKT